MIVLYARVSTTDQTTAHQAEQAGLANLGSLGTVFQPNAFGRPAGLYDISDQNVFAAMVRIQRNFLY